MFRRKRNLSAVRQAGLSPLGISPRRGRNYELEIIIPTGDLPKGEKFSIYGHF
jgi:hypothetical protein